MGMGSRREQAAAALQGLLERKQQGVTTVMLRNIPTRYTQRLLLRGLQDLSCTHDMDLLYLPLDSRKQRNLGYAFVDCCTPEAAEAFCDVVRGVKLPLFKSSKVLDTCPAKVQGFSRNLKAVLKNLGKGKNLGPEFQPLVFDPATCRQIPLIPLLGPAAAAPDAAC
mmetsp:Transcript_17203/g.41432  ORF Transcript_17203/g.41432 Transcript_17203/m.41432 type:complete len:166 (+) Transcript_17203:2-499(+)